MIKFEPQVGSFSIKARDLDKNFARTQPLPNGQYGIKQTDEGWSLDILPAFPQSTTQTLALAYEAGSLQWRSIEEITPEVSTAISPGANGSLYITTDNEAQWSEPPPSGTPAWRQVERCDGKTMYVWGTEWES